MQANTIAYTYNHDNDGGTTPAVSVVLSRHSEELNRTVYQTGSSSIVAPDLFTMYRTPAKRSGNFYGVQKVSVKRTHTRQVPTADGLEVSAAQIGELSFSIPVGVSNEEKLATIMEWIGFLSSEEGKAAMVKLLNTSEI